MGSIGDPFSATYGRTHMPVLSALHDINEQSDRELVCGVAVMFAALSGLMMLYYSDRGRDDVDRAWIERHWERSSCTVKSVGISYRGNCDPQLVTWASRDFQLVECMGPQEGVGQERMEAYYRSRVGKCAHKVDKAYWSGESDDSESKEDDDDVGDDMLDPTLMRRRLQVLQNHHIRHPRHRCQHLFLPWAEVLIANATGVSAASSTRSRCAYQYAAPALSTDGDWDTALRLYNQFKTGLQSSPKACWTLAGDVCTVAMNSLQELSDKQPASTTNPVRIVALVLACIFAAISVLACGYMGRNHYRNHGCCWGLIPPLHYDCLRTHEPGPQEEEEEIPLSDRVRNVVNVAAARFSEVTPVGSGEDSLRISRGSRRTIEIVGPSGASTTVNRNVAADFLGAGANTMSSQQMDGRSGTTKCTVM